MLLYHLNFGWPLVDEGTVITLPDGSTTAGRDADADAGLAGAKVLDAPIEGYAEQCFFHEVPSGPVRVDMVSPSGFGVTVSYHTDAFPFLTQWKMMGQGEYVVGIEPANCRVLGRKAEREAGRLQTIAPGEERRFVVTMTLRDR